MKDVFVDMTRPLRGMLGDADGNRCVVGAILWEAGVPHDQLAGEYATSPFYDQLASAFPGMVDGQDYKDDQLYAPHDAALQAMRQDDHRVPENTCWEEYAGMNARDCMEDMIRAARDCGINLICACPIHVYADKTVQPSIPQPKETTT